MTDRARTPRMRPAPRRKPSATPVVVGSLATFMALFGFMSYRLGTGHDPALSAQAKVPAAVHKRVVVKRMEHHVIVTKLLPPRDDGGEDDAPAQAAPAPVTQSAAAPASAPVVVPQSAPAPTSAPTPAPAPVVTQSS